MRRPKPSVYAWHMLIGICVLLCSRAVDIPINDSPTTHHGYATIDSDGRLSFASCSPGGCQGDAYHAAPAQAVYQPSDTHPSGFGVFTVQTNGKYSDVTQMKAAGYVEGVLTARATFDHYYNMKAWLEKECAATAESLCLLPNLAKQLALDGEVGSEEDDDKAEAREDQEEEDEASTAACGLKDTWDVEEGLECRRTATARAAGDSLLTAPGSKCQSLGGGVGDTVSAIMKWLAKMDAWIARKVAKKTSRYYDTLEAVQAQLDGFIAGYTTAAAQGRRFPTLARKDFTLLNGFGDANSLMKALKADARSAWLQHCGLDMNSTDSAQILRKLHSMGHCSAVIKLSGNLDDVWMGHSSWYTYASMTRIWKTYNFSLSSGDGLASFSSYPGMLSSLDDFYILGGNRVVLQTTNPVLNLRLYDRISKHSVPAWMRVRVANVLGTTGSKWASVLSRKNSGTYNNQYMVIDLNRFDRGNELRRHMLTVVEQLPGLVKWADMTRQLQRGYWPSYNIPYFREIYSESGFDIMLEAARERGLSKAMPGLSYQSSVRANLFRRDVGKVASLDDLKTLMRYNDWQNDSYSLSGPGDAICARFDLDPSAPTPDGCTDSKVTSYAWAGEFKAAIINGPTTDQQPPFSWEDFLATSHNGMPTTFEFAWEDVHVLDVKNRSLIPNSGLF